MKESTDIKHRISEKAKFLFLQLGIRSVSMADIAAAIGISKKTLYKSYITKEALVTDTVALLLSENIANCEKCSSKATNAIHEGFLAIETLNEMMRKASPALLYDLQKYCPVAYNQIEAFKDNYLYGVIAESIKWGIKDGLYREDFDIALASRLRVENTFLPFQKSFYEQLNVQPDVLHKEILVLFLFSIATPKGIQLINNYKTQTSY